MIRRRSLPAVSWLALAATLLLAAATPLPVGAAALADDGGTMAGTPGSAASGPTAADTSAQATASRVGRQTWSGTYSVYSPRSFSVQRNDFSCVGAAVQIMLNTIRGAHDRTKANQLAYWQYAQQHSFYPVSDNGADVGGWVAALEHWGAGSYYVDVSDSMQTALQHAAQQVRLTGRPAGLVVWGRHQGHAWVMTGFAATSDPAETSDFTVTSVEAMGPLWPLGTINGHPYDPGPQQWVGLDELTRKFTTYHAPLSPDWVGRWLTVLPS